MSDDLIERQAAIDALHMHLMYRMGTDSNKKRLDDWINGVPSVQQEQQWIPVSEKPKKDGRYQVTRYDYVANTEFIDILWYEENLWWNRHSTGDYAVTAWTPLPEPYKERREE